MAFPSNQSKPETLAEALDKVKGEAGRVKVFAQQMLTRSNAGPVSAVDIISYVGGLAQARTELARLSSVSGLSAYAQTEYPGLNIVTEFNTMAAQIDATITWVVQNFPKTPGTNELRERTIGADGRTTPVMFSTTDLAGFRTVLAALIATID